MANPVQQAQAGLQAYQTTLEDETAQITSLNARLGPGKDLAEINRAWNNSIVPLLSQRLTSFGGLVAQSKNLETLIGTVAQQDRDPLVRRHAQLQNAFENIRTLRSQLEGRVWDRQHEMVTGTAQFPQVAANTVPIFLKNENPVLPAAPNFTTLRLERQADGRYTLQGIEIQQQSLLSRACTAVWNNKVPILGAVALGLSGLAIASKIPATAEFATSVINTPGQIGTLMTQANTLIKPAYTFLTTQASKLAPYATMENIGSAASTIWALPKTISEWRKGNRKTAIATGLVGLAAGVAPHVIKSDMNKTLQATQDLGSKVLGGVGGLFKSAWGVAKDLPGISHATNFVAGTPEFFNTHVIEPFANHVAPHLTGANVISAGTALTTTAATVKTWRSGYRKSAVGVALGGFGLATGIALAPHAYTLGANGSFQVVKDLGGKALGGLSSIVSSQAKKEL